jgi:hypothetical protein
MTAGRSKVNKDIKLQSKLFPALSEVHVSYFKLCQLT